MPAAAVRPENKLRCCFQPFLTFLLTNDVNVVALFIHRLHLGVTELRHGPPSLHEVLVEFALQLELFARQ